MYIVHICNTSHTELPNNSNKPNEWVSKRIRVECNVRAFLMPVIIMISLLRWWSAFCDFYSFLCLKHAFHIVTFYGTWYVRPPMENGTLVAHLARMKWFSGKEETFSLSRQLFYGWNSTCIRIVCAGKSKAYIYVCVCVYWVPGRRNALLWLIQLVYFSVTSKAYKAQHIFSINILFGFVKRVLHFVPLSKICVCSFNF